MATGTFRKSRPLLAAFLCATIAAATALAVVLPGTANAAQGGPVVLLGIDAEDHGLSAEFAAVVDNTLSKVNNGGSGILVIGGGKDPSDSVTSFWNAIATEVGTSVTYANGVDAIQAQPFWIRKFADIRTYAMIAVVSSEGETPDGGLTQAENDALVSREADIATFVNGGGALVGFSQVGLDNPYAYLGDVGSVSSREVEDGFEDIQPTAEGMAVGITDELDVCCWHDEYTAFPDFLKVLARNVTYVGYPAAIGGANVSLCQGVCSVTPANGATGVPRGTNVTATFSDAMDPTSFINGSTIRLVKKGSTRPVAAGVSYDEVAKKVTLDPANSLASSTVLVVVQD
jgi:trimeric autotransporter adhesin